MTAAFFLSIFLISACGSRILETVGVEKRKKPDAETDYGFNIEAENPESDKFGLTAPNGWPKLPIKIVFDSKFTKAQQDSIRLAIKVWERAVGKTLFLIESVNEIDSFPDNYSSLLDEKNGFYINSDWEKSDRALWVLASTYRDSKNQNWRIIEKSDIHFNSQYYKLVNASIEKGDEDKQIVDLQTLATHEIGHMLGLAHVHYWNDSETVMFRSLMIGKNQVHRRISLGDIMRIQKIYGCTGIACYPELIYSIISQENINTSGTPGSLDIAEGRAAICDSK